MKDLKFYKLIKIWSLIETILLFFICFAIVFGRTINWDICPDAYKHLVYNLYKYSILSVLLLAIPIPFCLLVQFLRKFKKNCFNIFNILKTSLIILFALVLIALLFCYTKKYVIKIEIWYGYISLYVALLALFNYLIFSLYKLNSQSLMIYSKRINQIDRIKRYFKDCGFKIELFWILICSFFGLITMFSIKLVHQTITTIVMFLLFEIVIKMCLMFFVNNKYGNRDNVYFYFLTTIIMVTIFIIVSFFLMYPIKIIGEIKINYYLSFSNYLTVLIVVPAPCIISTNLL